MEENNDTTTTATTSTTFTTVTTTTTLPMTTTTIPGNESEANETITRFCQNIIFNELGSSAGVRAWDLFILGPNLVFFIFLLYKLKRIRLKLSVSGSPVFKAFYALVYLGTGLNILRCVVSIGLDKASQKAPVVDKLLWLLLKFCLLSAELCVLIFGLFFGQMESREAMKRVVTITIIGSGIFSSLQTVMELVLPVHSFYNVPDKDGAFTHGGLVFWACSSALFATVYALITAAPWILPRTPYANRLALPKKRRFYGYTGSLALLNFFQFLGVLLMLSDHVSGMCIVDLTSYCYFAFYTAAVYFTFLKGYLRDAGRNQMFSYRLHREETDDVSRNGGDGPSPPHLGPLNDDIFDPALPHSLNPLYAYGVLELLLPH